MNAPLHVPQFQGCIRLVASIRVVSEIVRLRNLILAALLAGIVLTPLWLTLYGAWQRTCLNAESVRRNTAYGDAWYARIEAIADALRQFKIETGQYPADKAEFIAFNPSFVALYDPLPHQLNGKRIEIWFELLDEDERLLIVPEPGYSFRTASGDLIVQIGSDETYVHGDSPWGLLNDFTPDAYTEDEYQRTKSLLESE